MISQTGDVNPKSGALTYYFGQFYPKLDEKIGLGRVSIGLNSNFYLIVETLQETLTEADSELL